MSAGREHSTAVVMFQSAVGDRFGLNATDLKALDILAVSGPLTAGEIAGRTGLATASVTTLIDRLEKGKFVRRVRDPKDRRRVIVETVGNQPARFAPLFESFGGAVAELFSSYTDEQLEIILDFLTRSAQRIREEGLKLARRGNPRKATGAKPKS